jgi:hypothetical protein
MLVQLQGLIDCDGVRLTSQNRGNHSPIVHPPAECEWRAVVMMMMPAGDKSWLVYQSSLAVLPAEASGTSRINGRSNEHFAHSVSLIRQRIFYMPWNFTAWDLRLYFPSEGRMLRISIVLKNPPLRPGLNRRPLGPVTSTQTTTPPTRLPTEYALKT